MNEFMLNFTGVDITYPENIEFAEEILNFMNNKLKEFQEKDNILYNLEATPAEGTSYRLAKKDKKEFPGIICCGKENPYYTNSTQLPANSKLNLFDALRHQDRLQPLYTGGTVFHTFLGESVDNPQSVKELVKLISSEYKLPYFTITPTFSICPIHGYLKGEHRYCPICKKEYESSKK
jgi:ribonucleoside-triphosphate reductase